MWFKLEIISHLLSVAGRLVPEVVATNGHYGLTQRQAARAVDTIMARRPFTNDSQPGSIPSNGYPRISTVLLDGPGYWAQRYRIEQIVVV